MVTDRARKAVTETVSSLWSSTKSDNESKPRPTTQSQNLSHDLFTDSPTDTRKMFGGSV